MKFSVNFDGLSISKSSTNCFWQMLCASDDHPVFMADLYAGNEKLRSANDFLQPLVDEIKSLHNNGIFIKSKRYKFGVKNIICDLPAKSFVLNVAGHSGYYSCIKCQVKEKEMENNLPQILELTVSLEDIGKDNENAVLSVSS